MRSNFFYSLFFVPMIFIGCLAPKNSLQPTIYRWPVMGTLYEVRWFAPASNQEELSKLMFEKVRWVDEKVSTYKSQSDVSKLNQNSGSSPFIVDEVTKELLEKSIQYRTQTDGWFDIATGALVQLWGLNEPVRGEERKIPSNTDVKKVTNVVQKTKISLHDQMASIGPKGAYIDMGAIAKGYALDQAHALSTNAACSVMNLGRQLMMTGKCTTPLQCGVQSPLDEAKILAIIELTTGSLSTSGSYERYFTHNNRKFTHILNPKTGYPVDADTLSVTVWAKSGIAADVWSTALFVAGLEEGSKIVERTKSDIGVLWILKGERIIYHDSTFGHVIFKKNTKDTYN